MKRLVLALLAALMMVGSALAPAWATDEIALSLDGRTFSRDLTAPVFGRLVGWAPGDRIQRTLWIRNTSPDDGRLQIELRATDDSALFGPGLAQLTATMNGQHMTGTDAGNARLVEPTVLPGGATVPVTLALELPAESSNVSQLRLERVGITVTLTQNEPSSAPPPHGGPGVLPQTGSPFGLAVLGLAAVSLGLGAALIVSSRREEQEPCEP